MAAEKEEPPMHLVPTDPESTPQCEAWLAPSQQSSCRPLSPAAHRLRRSQGATFQGATWVTQSST